MQDPREAVLAAASAVRKAREELRNMTEYHEAAKATFNEARELDTQARKTLDAAQWDLNMAIEQLPLAPASAEPPRQLLRKKPGF